MDPLMHPPGLSSSDGASAIASRERRRVSLAAGVAVKDVSAVLCGQLVRIWMALGAAVEPSVAARLSLIESRLSDISAKLHMFQPIIPIPVQPPLDFEQKANAINWFTPVRPQPGHAAVDAQPDVERSPDRQQQQQQQQQHGQGPPPPPKCEEQPSQPSSSVTDINMCTATLPSQQGTVSVPTISGATAATISAAPTATGGAASNQPAAHGQEMAWLEHMLTRQMNTAVDRTSLGAKPGVSKDKRPAGGSVLIGSSSGCSGSAANKCRSLSGSIAGGLPLGSRVGGGSISNSFAPMWRKSLGPSGSVEVEAATTGGQSPPVPQSAQRNASPKKESKDEVAHRSPSRVQGANSPQRMRVASPLRVRPTCSTPVQMVPAVRSPPHRTPFKESRTATFTHFDNRGTSPMVGTKKLGGSISSHTMSVHVRKATPDHVYPVREFASKITH